MTSFSGSLDLAGSGRPGRFHGGGAGSHDGVGPVIDAAQFEAERRQDLGDDFERWTGASVRDRRSLPPEPVPRCTRAGVARPRRDRAAPSRPSGRRKRRRPGIRRASRRRTAMPRDSPGIVSRRVCAWLICGEIWGRSGRAYGAADDSRPQRRDVSRGAGPRLHDARLRARRVRCAAGCRRTCAAATAWS